MNINYKKSMKFVFLILTSLLIATVSAETYKYMFMDGSITIGISKLMWIKGADAPSDSTITGNTFTADLDVVNGTLMNFTECVFLKNDNASGSYDINITITTAVLDADFDICEVDIYQNSSGLWAYVNTLDLTDVNDYYSGSLAFGNYLRFTFTVKAKPDATATKPFDLQVQY